MAILQGVSNSIRGIYTTKASGDFECTFVSETIEQILGYRFRHYDGHYRRFQDSFKTVHDDSGQPVEIVLKPQRRVDFNPNSMDVLHLDRLSILLADPEDKWLQAVASIETEEALEAIRVPIGPAGGWLAQAYQTKKAIIWNGQGPTPEELRLKGLSVSGLRHPAAR